MNSNSILVIAEKKSLAEDIAKALGNYTINNGYFSVGNYTVTHASGHMYEQKMPEEYDPKYLKWNMPDLPIIPPHIEKVIKRNRQTKKTDDKVKRQIGIIKDLLKTHASVIHAGDPDREGQIIVDEILTELRSKHPVKRLWLQEQTTPGIRQALKEMKDNKAWKALSLSAECRAEADWVLGMNATRGYTIAWQSRGHEGVLNVGRVKSPVIGLVVQRELEIENFIPKAYYVIRATINAEKGQFVARWLRQESDKEGFDEEGRLVDRNRADAIVKKTNNKQGVIVQAEKKRVKQSPPLLFSLGDLQRLAVGHGFSPDRTLEIAQALYNTHKVISYPRTTCSYAPESKWQGSAATLAVVKNNFGSAWEFNGTPDMKRKSPAWNDAKLEAHYGIIPTDQKCSIERLSPAERTIYTLVVRQWLAQFFPDYEYDSTTVIAKVEGEHFSATGQAPVIQGWREIIPMEKKSTDDESAQPLPPVSQGDRCLAAPVGLSEEKTKPPPRFNGASLLDAMEKAWKFVTDPAVKSRLKQTEGIGTPATRSNIIAEIIEAGFMREEKVGRANVYVPTQKARAYYKVIDPDLVKVDLTAYFEGKLEEITEGKLDREGFRTILVRFVDRIMSKLKDGSVAKNMPSPAELPPDIFVNKKKSSSAGKSGTASAARKRKAPAGPRQTPPGKAAKKAATRRSDDF